MPCAHALRTNLQFRPINQLVHYRHCLRRERLKYVLIAETLPQGAARGGSRGIGQSRTVYSPRRLRFSLSHLTLLHHSPPAFIELAAQAGYDFVGLRVIPLNLPGEPIHPLVSDARLRRQTKIALRNTGVGILDVELARILPDNDVSRYLPALKCAAELGARHVLSSAWCADRNFVRDQFCALCELARPLDLTVDFEFVTFAAYATLQHAIDLVLSAACPNAGLAVDTLHFDRSGHRPEELDAVPRDWFHYAQICDGPFEYSTEEGELKAVAREGRWYVGEGGVGVPQILSHLPDIPYSIELPNARRTAILGDELFARRCLVTARQCLEGQLQKSRAGW
jgi:sugar phosphate isomerase/epimerase